GPRILLRLQESGHRLVRVHMQFDGFRFQSCRIPEERRILSPSHLLLARTQNPTRLQHFIGLVDELRRRNTSCLLERRNRRGRVPGQGPEPCTVQACPLPKQLQLSSEHAQHARPDLVLRLLNLVVHAAAPLVQPPSQPTSGPENRSRPTPGTRAPTACTARTRQHIAPGQRYAESDTVDPMKSATPPNGHMQQHPAPERAFTMRFTST